MIMKEIALEDVQLAEVEDNKVRFFLREKKKGFYFDLDKDTAKSIVNFMNSFIDEVTE